MLSVTVFVALALSYYLLLICFVCLYEGGLRLWKHNVIMWEKKVIEINYFCNVFCWIRKLEEEEEEEEIGSETDGIIVWKMLSGVKNKEM